MNANPSAYSGAIFAPVGRLRSAAGSLTTAAMLLASFVGHAAGTPALFLYQGRLNLAGATAPDGLYTMQFLLYPTNTGGSLLMAFATNTVPVTNGLFSVTLNFGTNVIVGAYTLWDGSERWLDISVKQYGATNLVPLSPRQRLTAQPFAMWANRADSANTATTASYASSGVATSIAAGAVGSGALTANAVAATNIAAGQVVKSLNGLRDDVSLAAGPNVNLQTNGHQILISGIGGGGSWSLNGNSGTLAGTNFLGTTDAQPLELHVNNIRALRLDPQVRDPYQSINLIGGWHYNSVAPNVIGATIGGGGYADFFDFDIGVNSVVGDFGTVVGGFDNTAGQLGFIGGGGENSAGIGAVGGGGWQNLANGNYSVIAGGLQNRTLGQQSSVGGGSLNFAASDLSVVSGGAGNAATNLAATVAGGLHNIAGGVGSFAAGQRAQALHDGSWVWADGSSDQPFTSARSNQFLIRAANGVGLGTNNPQSQLHVVGTVTADAFRGDGSALANLSPASMAGVALLGANQVFGSSNVFAGVITATHPANSFTGSFTGNGAGLSNLNAATLSGTVTDGQLSTNVALLNASQAFTGSNAFSGVMTAANPSNQFAGTFAGPHSGDGSALMNLNADNVASGTLADARLSNNIARLNLSQTFTAPNLFSGTVTATNPASSFVGTFAGNGAGLTNLTPGNLVSGTAGISITGNAATATMAITAASAGGFTGSLAGDVTGTQSATVVTTVGGQTASNVASGAVAANAATSANTAGTIVKRDPSGGFNAGTITATNFVGNGAGLTNLNVALPTGMAFLGSNQTFAASNTFSGVVLATNLNNRFFGNGAGLTSLTPANLAGGTAGISITGNATTATTATTAGGFTGSLAGDVTGTQSATVVTTVGGQTASNVASGAGAANAATSANTAGTIVKRDPSGGFNAGTITATNFAGNGAGLTNLNVALPTGMPFLGSNQTFAASNVFNGVVTATNVNDRFGGTFLGLLAGDASGATNLNASSLASGSVPDARLSNNVARLNLNQTFTGTQNFVPASGAPFTVGNSTKISSLNADFLDGLDSTTFVQLSSSPTFTGTLAANGGITTISGVTANGDLAGARLNVGSLNLLSGSYASIAGGLSNTNTANWAFVGAGRNNSVQAPWAVIAGGDGNTIYPNGGDAVIAGGLYNANYASQAAIGGGVLNVIQDGASGSAISGGNANIIQTNAAYSWVGGGNANIIQTNASFALIGGGGGNVISNNASYATIPGGYLNSVSGINALAAGRQAKAIHQGAFVWADSTGLDFPSTANNQFSVRAAGGVRLVTGGFGATLDGLSILAGTVGTSQLSGTYANALTFNNAANSFAGNGASLTGLNASQLTAGTVPDARLATTVARTSQVWLVNGNAGTDPTTNFIGTTDNKTLELRVNGIRALRLEPVTGVVTSVNVLAGNRGNTVDSGVIGATIAGGGSDNGVTFSRNMVHGDYGVVSGGSKNEATNYACVLGGLNNQALGSYGAVAGGISNYAGPYSYAAGTQAKANHSGSFVWADNSGGDFATANSNTFIIRATGGVGIGVANPTPGFALDVAGSAFLEGDLLVVRGSTGNEYPYLDGTNNQVRLGSLGFGVNSVKLWNNGFGHSPGLMGLYASFGDFTTGVRMNGSTLDLSGSNDGLAYYDTFGNQTVNGPVLYGATNGALGVYSPTNRPVLSWNYGGVSINTNNSGGAALYVQGNRTGSWGQSVGWFENTSTATNAAPALRVVCDGGTTLDGALSVSSNGHGLIAEFGNAGSFVVTITNDGTIYCKGAALTSDRNAKEHFTVLDSRAVLAKVVALPVTEWNYRDDAADKRHIGPVAQDFYAAFQLGGTDDKHISVVDEGGVALAAIQGLNQKLEERDARIAVLENELSEIRQAVRQLSKNKP